MIFGLFKNKQGQLMLEETFRTLSKASEQPKKSETSKIQVSANRWKPLIPEPPPGLAFY